jgi:hypothetical protein
LSCPSTFREEGEWLIISDLRHRQVIIHFPHSVTEEEVFVDCSRWLSSSSHSLLIEKYQCDVKQWSGRMRPSSPSVTNSFLEVIDSANELMSTKVMRKDILCCSVVLTGLRCISVKLCMKWRERVWEFLKLRTVEYYRFEKMVVDLIIKFDMMTIVRVMKEDLCK